LDHGVDVHGIRDFVLSVKILFEKLVVDHISNLELFSNFSGGHRSSFDLSNVLNSLGGSLDDLVGNDVLNRGVIDLLNRGVIDGLLNRGLLDWCFVDGHFGMFLLHEMRDNSLSVVGEHKVVILVENVTVTVRDLVDSWVDSLSGVTGGNVAATSVTIESASWDSVSWAAVAATNWTTVASARRSRVGTTTKTVTTDRKLALGTAIGDLLGDLDVALGTAVGKTMTADGTTVRASVATTDRGFVASTVRCAVASTVGSAVARTVRGTIGTTVRGTVSATMAVAAATAVRGTISTTVSSNGTVAVAGAAVASAAIGSSTIGTASWAKSLLGWSAVGTAVSFTSVVAANLVKRSIKISTDATTMTGISAVGTATAVSSSTKVRSATTAEMGAERFAKMATDGASKEGADAATATVAFDFGLASVDCCNSER